MSYDVHLEIDTGGSEPLCVGDWNYTWNCSPMFYDVLKDGVNGLDGLSCSEAAKNLDTAIAKMEGDPSKYEAMNPENGWGNYRGAMQFLRAIREGCKEHPKCTVRVT